jgi:hypothetical protein
MKFGAMHRLPRRAAIALAALALVLVAARVALERWVTARARGAVAALAGRGGTIADVDVRLRDLSCTLQGLRLEKRGTGGASSSVLEVPVVRVRLAPRPLLRGRLVVTLELEAPRLVVTQARKRGREPPPGAPQEFPEAPRVGRDIARFPALVVERAEVRDGELRYVLAAEPRAPVLRLHGIELTVENLPTRRALATGAPAVLAARATLQRTGAISVFATADPAARRATFAGRAHLRGLRFAELGDLVAGSGVEPDRGVVEMEVRFNAADGKIAGAVRPTVTGGGTRPAEPQVADRIKSALADDALDLFDDAAAAKAGATTIPMVGTVKEPDAQPFPTVIGVLRNAFVQGLTATMRGPPPPEARARAPAPAKRAVAPGRARARADGGRQGR